MENKTSDSFLPFSVSVDVHTTVVSGSQADFWLNSLRNIGYPIWLVIQYPGKLSKNTKIRSG